MPVAEVRPVKVTFSEAVVVSEPVQAVVDTGPLSICVLMETAVSVCDPLFRSVTTGVKAGLHRRCEGLLMPLSWASMALRTTG